GVLVRHEMFEAVDAVLAYQAHHVLAHALVPPGDGDVEGVVDHRLLRPLAPLVPGLHDALLRIGYHEVDDHGGAAGEPGGGAAVEIVAGHRAHERQLHVRVRIDAAGHDVLPARVDDLALRGRIELLADLRDLAVHAQHVAAVRLVRRDDRAALDQHRHYLPRSFELNRK